jgi:hypothetical protein
MDITRRWSSTANSGAPKNGLPEFRSIGIIPNARLSVQGRTFEVDFLVTYQGSTVRRIAGRGRATFARRFGAGSRSREGSYASLRQLRSEGRPHPLGFHAHV